MVVKRAMNKIRLGIIGAGSIVRSRHVPGFRRRDDVEIVVVCNRTPESTARAAEELQIHETAVSPAEVIERRDLDAVLIGTWPYLHAKLSIDALRAGKHVFCQARMARSVEEARRMVRTAEQHPSQVAMLCPPPHGLLWDRWVRRLLTENALGDLLEVHLDSLSSTFLDPHAPLHWRQNWELQGWNTLTLGMLIEVMHRWIGPHVSLQAVARTRVPMRSDPLSGEVREVRTADSLSILAELECGATGSYRFSGITAHAPSDRISIYGARGALHYDFAADTASFHPVDSEMAETPDPSIARPWQVEADFAEAVLHGRHYEPTFADGLLYMEFTEAVYQAAHAGQRVALPAAGGNGTEASSRTRSSG